MESPNDEATALRNETKTITAHSNMAEFYAVSIGNIDTIPFCVNDQKSQNDFQLLSGHTTFTVQTFLCGL